MLTVLIDMTIDGQVHLVHLVRLQTDNFCLFLCQQTGQMTNVRLPEEQTVNRLRKIVYLDICFLFETVAYIYSSVFCVFLYVYVYMVMEWQLLFVCCKWKTETTNDQLFAANGNQQRKFASLGWQMINSCRRFLFQ